jgi:beta-glucosidase
MESWKDDVEAILVAWYPGMEGGRAVADVVSGDVNPSGKLPITFPESVTQLPFFDRKAKSIEYGYYHGYRLFDREGMRPAFPFGFGLSYTEYDYKKLKLSEKKVSRNGALRVSADITNKGGVAGEEIVQLYVACRASKVDRPKKELKGFARVALQPGETKTVELELEAQDLACYDTETASLVVEEAEYTVFLGSSSREEDLHLTNTFVVSGT